MPPTRASPCCEPGWRGGRGLELPQVTAPCPGQFWVICTHTPSCCSTPCVRRWLGSCSPSCSPWVVRRFPCVATAPSGAAHGGVKHFQPCSQPRASFGSLQALFGISGPVACLSEQHRERRGPRAAVWVPRALCSPWKAARRCRGCACVRVSGRISKRLSSN